MHPVKPLPFDPSKLRGLSERLILSHHDNNYGGAVKNPNRTEEELARVTKRTPPLLVAALKERELTFANSATGPIEGAVAADCASFGWSGNHTQACAFGQPLPVLDMYEHAYALDYGAAAGRCVDAFFQSIQWDEVNRRLESAPRRSS